jgi:2-oxoglutarate-Fe(II)-dependent oxygenase superfamily protein/methyltransferase family protein
LSMETNEARRLAVLDLENLERHVDSMRGLFGSAHPFPHVVLDDFLQPDAAREATAEFSALIGTTWHSYSHVNEAKFSHTDPAAWGPGLQAVLEVLNSRRFVAFLSELTGIEGLMADPALEGGGLHRSTRGGYLNIHADFTVHPHHVNWARRLNLILYLNKDWQPEYGGELELWSADMKQCVESIAPVGNRAVIFETGLDSFHGHPEPMPCPDGVHRCSLALYYFTREEAPVLRSTEYRGRPGDGPRAALIYADKQVLRVYDRVKRRFGLSDEVAWNALGGIDRLRTRTFRGPRSKPSLATVQLKESNVGEHSSDDLRAFFDRQQVENKYESLKAMTRELDVEAGLQLNTMVNGDVLSVGGVWDFFSWSDRLKSLTVLDLSNEMLKEYCPQDAVGVVGDLYSHEFPDQSFDTVVFPLMLHHTPEGNWRSCEARIEEAVTRAKRWLREDGQVVILEYCPAPIWVPFERALLPVTRRFLARFGQPLVVMYPQSFYEGVLREQIGPVESVRIDPEGFDYSKWYPVFMSIRWLRMPMSIYPKLHVIRAKLS